MKHILVTLFFFYTIVSFAQSAKSKSFIFDYCEAEGHQCQQKCKVELIEGEKIMLGSYIKVYLDKKLITEGYILKHKDGSILILKSKKDANDPDIGGGCKGPAYDIDIKKEQIWGC